MIRPRHWRLDGRVGWRGVSPDGAVRAEQRLELRVVPGDARPLVDGTGSFGGFSEATGISVDDRGDVYVLDGRAGRIERYDACTRRFEPLPCVGGAGSAPRQLDGATGLAMSPWGDLYVVDAGNARVQVFARKGWTLRHILGPFRADDASALRPWSGGGPRWQPWDVAITPDGHVLVSDRSGALHLFDRHGRWRARFDAADRPSGPLVQPTHLAVDRSGRIYVIENGRDTIVVLSTDGRFETQIDAPEGLEGRFCPVGVAVDEAGTVYVTERVTGRLHEAAAEAARLRPSLAYEGIGPALAFDRDGGALLGAPRSVLLASRTARAAEGQFLAGPLDGRREGCLWHRIIIEGAVPEAGAVELRAFTSDQIVASLPAATSDEWQQCGTRRQGEGTWDCLVHAPPGRYLWLALTLRGDGTSSPVIEALRVEYPRRTSASFLPALYQQDAESWSFVDRFAAIADAGRLPAAETLDGFTRYLSPDGVPADPDNVGHDFLAWLSGWLGILAEGEWSEAQRRALLRAAPQLYRWRGTLRGLREHVRIYTGIEPTVLEHFRLRRWLFVGSSRLGSAAELWGADIVDALEVGIHATIGEFELSDRGDRRTDLLGVHAHRFTLYAPAARPLTDAQTATLEAIVDEAKPAHTDARVIVIGPRMTIGGQSRVGIDTLVGAYPSGVTTGEARLGRATVLSASADEAEPPSLRVGIRSRIGTHTLID